MTVCANISRYMYSDLVFSAHKEKKYDFCYAIIFTVHILKWYLFPVAFSGL